MAHALDDALTAEPLAGLLRLLITEPHPDLCTKAGTLLAFKKKGKWLDAAKQEGLAKAKGERLNLMAEACYAACCKAWQDTLQTVASRVLSDVIVQVEPVLNRFRAYKRSAALLDFDDLIFAAPDLLRDHDKVHHYVTIPAEPSILRICPAWLR
jgi:exodeoxyribonuclease-5